MRDDENGVSNGRPVPATNGHRWGGDDRASTRVLAADDEAQGPTDLVAVQADDELVGALGARPGTGLPIGSPYAGRATDDRLVAMLAAWRAEIDAEPIPELVDLDTAVAAVVAGMQADELATRRRRSGRLRQLAPLGAAAAIIVATVTGVGLGSQDAMPGDTLWAIQKVVNPERAESVEAKVAVEGHLQKARTALQSGDTAAAAQELQAATTQISSVRGQEGQPQLAQERQFLAAKLADTPPGTKADLTTPAKSDPTARPTGVPVLPPPPPSGSAATVASTAPSSTEPSSTGPDVRVVPERPSEPVVPPKSGGPPVLPAPEQPAPPLTSAPEATLPPQHSEPPTGTGKDEGGPDPRIVPPKPDPGTPPGPVDQTPPSAGDGAAKPGGDTGTAPSSDTTTASGSAGASVEATATDTTT